jgi:hypothetical protein
MIAAGDIEFPNNVIELITFRVPTFVDGSSPLDSRIQVFKRPLRQTDPQQCVGVFPAMKRPDPRSSEIGFRGQSLNRYSLILQSMVKSTDEAEAISVHSILANRLSRMFHHDLVLDAGLTALAVNVDNIRERLQRRGIELQRYLDNQVEGTFVRTSWIECWFETETVEI